MPATRDITDVINEMAQDADIKALAVPPSIEATQNHYGHYMSLIDRMATQMPVNERQVVSLNFWAAVLIKAGGNEQGIRDAIRALGADA